MGGFRSGVPAEGAWDGGNALESALRSDIPSEAPQVGTRERLREQTSGQRLETATAHRARRR